MTLEDLFARVLHEPAGSVTEASTNQTLKKWDSFNQIQLVIAMEETYKVKFNGGEIASFRTVLEAKQLLRKKGVAL
jgi:acyl carrier protein